MIETDLFMHGAMWPFVKLLWSVVITIQLSKPTSHHRLISYLW